MAVAIWDQKWDENLNSKSFNDNDMLVVKNIADNVLPLVFAALCVLPGGQVVTAVGTMAAAVFSVLWSKFGGEVGSADDRKEIELIKKIVDISEKQAKRFVSSEVRGRINGKTQTAHYVCSKFSAGLKDWYALSSEERNKPQNVLPNEFNDCDNFQKDLTTALDNSEYSDVLLPAIGMSMAFYTPMSREAMDHGKKWGMRDSVINIIKDDTYKRIDQMINLFGDGLYKKDKNGHSDIYFIEGEACRMLNTQLYYNKNIYPYGVPWRNDVNETNSINNQKHLQYFNLGGSPNQMNCIMGPTLINYHYGDWGGIQEVDMKVGKTGTYTIRALYYIYPDNEDLKYNISPSFGFKNTNKSFKEKHKIIKKYKAPIIYRHMFTLSNGQVSKSNFMVARASRSDVKNSVFIIKELGTSHFEKGKLYHMRASTRFKQWSFVGFELIMQ